MRLRPLRFCAALLALAVVAAFPLHAIADEGGGVDGVLLAAKGFDFEGPNAPGDLTDSNDVPTLGAAAAGGGAAILGHSGNVQVNDPNLDNIQDFPNALPQPQRPFEGSIQSETSVATFGSDVVVGFNNSADQPVEVTAANTLAFVHRFLSGVGVSHDGGRTWTETSLPPIPGSPFTFGDPALTVDRQGNFYYASLGADAGGNSLVFVGKSSDRGRTFQPGVTVAIDPGSDKEWIGAGRDPLHPTRDNVYVTWTSFKANSSQLMLGRSTDGGQTFTTSTIFAPQDNGVESAFLQFSNPVVDPVTGRLYIPFLHGGDTDADYVKVLISDNGGQTFHFSNFNVPGVADPTAFPVVTPGTLSDCGTNGGFRPVLHAGPNLGGGRLGLPRFENATRLITQPSTAVINNRVFIALNASSSAAFGDPNSQSSIELLFSPDGGATWQGPFTVAAASAAQPQHVHPAVTVDRLGLRVTVGYYSQLANDQLRFDSASGVMVGGRNAQLIGLRNAAVGPAFDLIPSNIPIPTATNPNLTTNYDRTIRPCYDIGEYPSATQTVTGSAIFAWGDNRNQWTSPPDSPAAGTHTQPDVFAATAN